MNKQASRKEPAPESEYRCPRCDSIVPEGGDVCVMCGLPRAQQPLPVPASASSSIVESAVSTIEDSTAPRDFESTVRETRSSVLFWIVTVVVLAALTGGWLALRDQAPEVMAAFIPTTTPLPPTITPTPTWTALPSDTPPPSATPPPTDTPAPTSTPRDPRSHTVAAGETLFGLSLLYRVSADSIAQGNGFDVNTPIQAGQSLVIPWPTATPPLESVLLEINGEQVLADATNCEIVEIQSGDSAYALSALKGVPLEAIITVNRQTQESIQLLQPGDTLCIPRIVYGDAIPPTAGPSPTPSLTPPPDGPALLYPVDGATIASASDSLLLQWTAVKNLADDEWYMIEMRDAGDRDSLPRRGFTRDSSFRVPVEWRPEGDAPRRMEWTVSIVRETGRRSDGGLIYTFGGNRSVASYFLWD